MQLSVCIVPVFSGIRDESVYKRHIFSDDMVRQYSRLQSSIFISFFTRIITRSFLSWLMYTYIFADDSNSYCRTHFFYARLYSWVREGIGIKMITPLLMRIYVRLWIFEWKLPQNNFFSPGFFKTEILNLARI